MFLRFVFCISAILVVVPELIDGCSKQAKKPSSSKTHSFVRKTREVDAPIIAPESDIGLLLRPRKSNVKPRDTNAEGVFRRIDTDSDGVVDAAEWVDFSKVTSIWDFVKLLDYADINNDETVSLDEFMSVQIVKFDQSEEEDQDNVDVTSS